LAAWLALNGVGVGILLGVGGAVFSAAYAAVGTKASFNASQKTHAEFMAFKVSQEAAVEKALAMEKEVLRAQSESSEKSLKAQADSVKAHVDSVKGQAWAAYLLPTLTSMGAIFLSGFALYTGKKV
jgi:hypothetical protein